MVKSARLNAVTGMRCVLLADKRGLADSNGLGADGMDLLHAWYCDGFLLPG